MLLHRILDEILPSAKCAIARELTKKFEEVLEGTPRELIEIIEKRNKINVPPVYSNI